MGDVRIISWNLLRLVGATSNDIASLIKQYKPDLLLMQEAVQDLVSLPAIAGGYVFHSPLKGRVYGLAVWSPVPILPPDVLPLPVSTMPGRVPLRIAQIVRVAGISFANVHLSHGQFLNRWQLLHLARSLDGPAAILGDYNAVGPIRLAGLKDVGPREPTHVAGQLVPVRLDRCMVRGLSCESAQVLHRGASDHRPIMVRLGMVADPQIKSWRHEAMEDTHHSDRLLTPNVRRWLSGLAQGDIWHTGPRLSGRSAASSPDHETGRSGNRVGAREMNRYSIDRRPQP